MFQVSSALQKDLPHTLQSGTYTRFAVPPAAYISFPPVQFLGASNFCPITQKQIEYLLGVLLMCERKTKQNKTAESFHSSRFYEKSLEGHAQSHLGSCIADADGALSIT